MYWIDAHAHISFFSDHQLLPMLADGVSKNLRCWILAGYDANDWESQLSLHAEHPGQVAPVLGLHPWRVIEMTEGEISADLSVLASLLPRARALGETGIDKFKTQDVEIIKKQISAFERHLELNKNHNLPLVLHVVRAENEALEVLKKHDYRGVLHGFSGSYETAKRFVDRGYKISVGRGVYRKGYTHLKECVIKLPLSDILVESDAALEDDGVPENAVQIYFDVVAAVCALKNVTADELMRQNYKNVTEVFGL